MTMDKLAELARIVGAQVSIDKCGHCGQAAELESVNDSGNGTATIQLRCHGEASRRQVKGTGAERIRLVPFENDPGRRASDRLGGITTGPFRGGITR
jgi:hypothetical protein